MTVKSSLLAGIVLYAVSVLGCDNSQPQSSQQGPPPGYYEAQDRQYQQQLDKADEQMAHGDRQIDKWNEQNVRFDALLDKWEEQARRIDAILDGWERALESQLDPPK